ncbi:MAG: hypothetical protein J6V44_15950 [Methanobrevibacter sp.]|nr:hypothetical protein [Methanobrevibacter sp.]
MNKQIEQIKQIATELGIIFEDNTKEWQCEVKIPSAYYVTDGDYVADPSSVYIFRYDEERITDCMCFNNLIFDTEHDGKLIWVGKDNYDPAITTPNYKEIKKTLTECLKELKEKEEQFKIKKLEKDFE